MTELFKPGDRVILDHDFYVSEEWCLSNGRQGVVVEVDMPDVRVDFNEKLVTARWVEPYYIRVIVAVERLALIDDE